MPVSFRITLLVSVSLHMACFGIFEPTFGSSLQKLDFVSVSFLGPILQTADFFPSTADSHIFLQQNIGKYSFFKPPSLTKKKENSFLTFRFKPIKPMVALTQSKQMLFFISGVDSDIFAKRKKEPTIVFHPPLPYSFLLYFQDRQIAHIEFMFYISRSGEIASIKRKISSGNLDADLLALRYITHCLNLVEGKFSPETWQTVKIDLTRKND